MQAKSSVKKPGPGIGRHSTKLLADAQGESPLLFPHQMMKPKLKHLRAILKAGGNRIQLRERFARHAQLCVAAGGLQLPFELHGSYLANPAPTAEFRAFASGLYFSKRVSSSASRRSKTRRVLSIGAEVVMSTPAACKVSRGNLEPPDLRKAR